MTKILAWHFAAADRRLAYGDGRAIVDGETLTHAGPVVLCESGLHASTRIMDALQYAPGPVVCRVRLSGTVVRGHDKIAASSRQTLWSIDATRVLRLHAVDSAIVALERVGSPDPRSLAALGEVLRQLAGGARDGAASDAARAAARAAASDAASDAAWDAAWDAASDAAWAAARAAARAAASDAAWAAASDAASDAAWAAAWATHSARLRALISMERRGVLMPEIERVMARLDRLAKGGE